MAYGEVYVEVDASVVNNGISTLSISGEQGEQGGEEFIVVWLLWSYDEETGEGGFSGVDWYFDDTPLKSSFGNEQEFKEYLRREKPTDLNQYLGSWDKQAKIDFIKNHPELGVVGGTGAPNGCIDYR